MRRRKKNGNSWISISDLMSGVLAVFIIYFVIQSINLQLGIAKLDSERGDYKRVIDKIYSVKIDIIEKIRKNLDVEIDEKTGAIKLDSSILFDSDEYKIKPEGKEYLKKIIPEYLKILLGDKKIRKNLSGIIIEGHTDKQGSYLYNLNLSQRRANSVVQFIFSNEMPTFQEIKYLKKYITSNGRSYSFYLGKEGTWIDSKSRRVEIKFELNDSEVIEQLKELVEKNNGAEI